MPSEAASGSMACPTSPVRCRRSRRDGFSDAAAGTAHRPDRRPRSAPIGIALGVRPVFKRIDTCAAEFEARTPYMYSAYETGLADDETAECEARP